jgi:Immunity protein 42
MTVGDPSIFALESGITRAYERKSFRALGFFTIHIGGHCYGRRTPDSTMLACSFDEVERRINRRGGHVATFAESDAGEIADAVRQALYGLDQVNKEFFGMRESELSELVYSKSLLWAPDGDEAFDDGSYVLQFDVGNRVRLIAFRSVEGGCLHDAGTLKDIWIAAGEFYHVLQAWHDAFEAEWMIMVKSPEF